MHDNNHALNFWQFLELEVESNFPGMTGFELEMKAKIRLANSDLIIRTLKYFHNFGKPFLEKSCLH